MVHAPLAKLQRLRNHALAPVQERILKLGASGSSSESGIVADQHLICQSLVRRLPFDLRKQSLTLDASHIAVDQHRQSENLAHRRLLDLRQTLDASSDMAVGLVSDLQWTLDASDIAVVPSVDPRAHDAMRENDH